MNSSYTLDDLESDLRHFRDLIEVAAEHYFNNDGIRFDSLLWIIRDEAARMVDRGKALQTVPMTGGQAHG